MLESTIIKNEIKKSKDKIKEYKINAEANIIGSIYKDNSLVYSADIEPKDFVSPIWGLYYIIINDLMLKEKKEHVDQLTIELYLEKRPKMKELYDKYKGWQTISELVEMTSDKNFESYKLENTKWRTTLSLLDNGILLDIKSVVDMSIDDLHSYYEALFNDCFLKANHSDIFGIYDISENLEELINELDSGINVGLPYHNLKTLNFETGGQAEGNLTAILAGSGVGKSTFTRSCILPSVIEHGEQIMIFINEEGLGKYQSEMLVWVANNVFKFDVQKYKIRDGKFEKEFRECLDKSKEWLEGNSKKIFIVPFRTWNCKTAIKIIKKYKALGIKHFIIDTFKAGSENQDEAVWMSLQRDAVKLYDTIKPQGKNDKGVHLTITAQLGKEAFTKRYLGLNNIGMSKNMADVCSTVIMLRDVLSDEYAEEKHALKVYEIKGKGSKIPVTLDDSKRHQIIFIPKTRSGEGNMQIVMKTDLSRNIYKEIGITFVAPDF